MPRKIYQKAESVLLRDKLNERRQLKVLSKDLEDFLSSYILFDHDDFYVGATLTDSFVLTVQVKVKNFKRMATSDD